MWYNEFNKYLYSLMHKHALSIINVVLRDKNRRKAMKNYLLLEDGTYFMADGGQSDSNVFGELVMTNHQIGIKCKSTGAILKTKLSETETQIIEQKLANHSGFLGKFIVDELPMDYHIYDLKTAF